MISYGKPTHNFQGIPRSNLARKNKEGFASNGNKEAAMSYVSLLKVCAIEKDLQRGMDVHATMLKEAAGLLETNPFVGSSLIHMYARCGDLSKAREVLNQLPVRNEVCWNAMISGYAQKGRGKEALCCFDLMQREGFSPQASTFTSVLKACGTIGALGRGEQIHEVLTASGNLGLLEEDIVLGNALVDMYARCGMLTKAQQVLDELPGRDVVSWNALISGYTRHGYYAEALESFSRMKMEGLSPNPITFTCVLKACGNMQEMVKGTQTHNDISHGDLLGKDVILGNALIDMYVSCGALAKAVELFDELPLHDVVSWNVIISGLANNGLGEEALGYYELMQMEGAYPDAMIFSCILKACGSAGAISKGREIHREVVSKGLTGDDLMLDAVLMGMMNSRCNDAFAKHGPEEGSSCYQGTRRDGTSPNTANSLMSSTESASAIGEGEEVPKVFSESRIVLGTALIDMYSRCGAVDEAKRVHDNLPIRDVVSWNALICGYIGRERDEEALSCLGKMQAEGLSPDAITFACVLRACAGIGAIDRGRELHREIARSSSSSSCWAGKDPALGNALVSMYAKCGELAKAQELLDDLAVRDQASWPALMAGYAQRGLGEEASRCFERMKIEGIAPSPIVFASVLKACSKTGAIDKGKGIHGEIACEGGGGGGGGGGLLKRDAVLASAVVGMYARCGLLPKARELLRGLVAAGSVVGWSCLIAAYAEQGQGREALECFGEMRSEDEILLRPNPVTFLSLLSACSHAGLVDEGLACFGEMTGSYGLEPSPKHYTCVVDLFGRAGRIESALAVIMGMPSCCDYAPLWAAFLASCRKQRGNARLAELAVAHAVQLDVVFTTARR